MRTREDPERSISWDKHPPPHPQARSLLEPSRSRAGRGAVRHTGYTSVSTRRRSIRRTLPSTATRLVMLRAKSSGNQPVSPSLSRSP